MKFEGRPPRRGAIHVLDVTRPHRPRVVRKTTIDGSAGDYRVSFKSRRHRRKQFLALDSSAVRSPHSVVADTPSTLKRRGRAVDYVLITSSDMVGAAQILADYRKSQGLRTLVVDVEDVYDEFNHGIASADAIWAFLSYAHAKWRTGPRYVVLAGEGSYDYKNYLGFGDSIIPTVLTPTPDGLFPSDNLYADVTGNDWVPEMAIGRLPVISAEELAAVAAKIIAYESSGGDWETNVTLSADAPDLGGEFPEDSNAVGSLLPDSYTVERVHLDD